MRHVLKLGSSLFRVEGQVDIVIAPNITFSATILIFSRFFLHTVALFCPTQLISHRLAPLQGTVGCLTGEQ